MGRQLNVFSAVAGSLWKVDRGGVVSA